MNQVTHDGQRWSNADADQIILVEHDWGWSVLFAQEAASLRAVLDVDFVAGRGLAVSCFTGFIGIHHGNH